MGAIPARHFDAQIDDTLVEVKSGLDAARSVRTGLLDLAYALQEMPSKRGLLVASGSRMSAKRLQREWQLASRALRPDIVKRLGVAFLEQEQLRGFPRDP